MIIKQISQGDINTYERIAAEHGTIFNSLEWLAIFGDKVQVYGIYNKGNNLIGGFTVYKERKFGLSIYRNPPFTPAIGPFLKVEAQNPAAIMDTWKKVLTLMVNFIESLPYSIILFSLGKDIIDTQPFIWEKFKVIPGYTYLLDLSVPLEDIFKRMASVRRNDINKGLKDGLYTKQVHDFDIIKKLVHQTFSRQDKKINEFYLNKILFEFAKHENSFAFVTYNSEKPIACTFCVHDNNTAYYLIGGYNFENKHHGAGALSIWEAIKYAKNIGLHCFDFEGSMVPQIERYFRGFGGQLTPYYRINKAKLPLEILLKFYKRELF